jgi:hypothetical protein
MRLARLAAGTLALGVLAALAVGTSVALTKRHDVIVVNATGSDLEALRLTFGHTPADQVSFDLGAVRHLEVRRAQFAHPGEAGYVFWSGETMVGQCGYADARRNEVVAVLAPALPGGATCTSGGSQSLLDAIY